MSSAMARTIPKSESMTVEFKSDRPPLPDAELAKAVVCLANADGGALYLGVENDGTITGVSDRHDDPSGLAAVVASRTSPPVNVRASRLVEAGKPVVAVEVPKAVSIVSTTDGTFLRRRLDHRGLPECVPLLAHEFITRQSDLRLADVSLMPVRGASVADFDPLERVRLRQLVVRFNGDRALLALGDEEFDAAIRAVHREGSHRVPTLLGLLMLGTERALREHVPTHEVAFQVLEGTAVRVNEFMHFPLAHAFERLEEMFTARQVEREVQFGLFRIPVPNIDLLGFREAVANALTHRDYTRLGAVHVRWEAGGLVISNPGGFVEGVSLDKLLTTDPCPRNPALADAFKRLGVVERTGRGVDLIFERSLRFGKPAPSYAASKPVSVVLRLSDAEPDLPFFEVVLEQEKKRGSPLPADTLLILSLLRTEKRVGAEVVAKHIQRDDADVRRLLESLVEEGLVAGQGERRDRVYMLSAAVYRKLGREAAYVRQAGFDAIQQEQMVLRFAKEHGRITRRQAADLCGVSENQAGFVLKKLRKDGKLRLVGAGRGAQYVA